MKKLDWLVLRAFLGPFVVTFFVTLFVLVMQFFWLYMDELLGKGLGIGLIFQLLFLMSATLVSLALPLSLLLASIMTFGNLGESFQLIAVKASGVSLLRFMRPLLILSVALSGVAFLFNNYFIPVANLRALSLLYDLRNSKPALNIQPGLFNKDIDNYTIRVGSKDPDGRTIRDVVVYDHSGPESNINVVRAARGAMTPSADKRALTFRLQDGWRYEDRPGKDGPGTEHVRMHFQRWDKIFDLSGMQLSRTSQELFAGDQKMMSVDQLRARMDTMRTEQRDYRQRLDGYLHPFLTVGIPEADSVKAKRILAIPAGTPRTYDSTFLELVSPDARLRTAQGALGSARSAAQLVNVNATSSFALTDRQLHFAVKLHEKFSLSAACIVLFLVGAPLGAIIRRGGLGMPMLVAICLFMVWYVLSHTGEKVALQRGTTPAMGMWLSTAVLFPIGVWLVYQARNDSQLLSRELYARFFKSVLKAIRGLRQPRRAPGKSAV